MSAKDEQVGGDHYKAMKIQPVEFIEANGIGFCAGNVIKYVCRYKAKSGAEDLRKARHYIDLLLEQIEKGGPFVAAYRFETAVGAECEYPIADTRADIAAAVDHLEQTDDWLAREVAAGNAKIKTP